MVATKENELTNEYINKDDKKSLAEKSFYNITQLTILLTLSVIPILFIKLKSFDYLLIRIAAMLILTISFTALMAKNLKYLGKVIQRDSISLFLLLYFIFLLISLFFSENLVLSIFGRPKRFEGLITLSLYMYLFIIARVCPSLKQKHWIFILTTSLLVALFGIIQFYGYYPLADEVLKNFGGRPYSTMGNPNFLGTYLVLLMPVGMHLFIIYKNRYGLIVFGILLYCLMATNTRGSWLGAMASIFIYVILHYKKHNLKKDHIKRYIVLLIIAIIVILIFNYQVDGKLLNRFLTISQDAQNLLTNNDQSDNAGAQRGFIWKRVILMIKERPIFGYGIENMLEPFINFFTDDMIKKYGEIKYFDKAHNEYLNIAVTTGIPSLLIYMAFILNVLKKGLSNISNNITKLLLFSSIFGYLVQAFFNISMPVTAYVFWVLLGLLSSKEI